MTFYNVYNQKEKTYDTLFFRATPFHVGPKVADSAGQSCIDDGTKITPITQKRPTYL